MNFSSQNVLINFLILFISISCKTSYQSRVFAENSLPLKPNYAEPNSWAVFPGRYPLALKDFIKIKENYLEKGFDVLSLSMSNKGYNTEVNYFPNIIIKYLNKTNPTKYQKITTTKNDQRQTTTNDK